MSCDKDRLEGSNKISCSENMLQNLQPKQELCLSAYVDGECGWLKRIFARRALQSNFAARKFVDELERTSGAIQSSYGQELDALSEDISLWPRISARIAQEERLTLLRSIPLESPNPFSWVSRLGWSGMGAVAASILFLVYLPVDSSKVSTEFVSKPAQLIASNSAVNFQQEAVSQVSAQGQVPLSSQDGFPGPGRVSDDDYRALQLASLQANGFSGSTETARRDPNAWRFIQQEPRFVESDRSSGLSLQNERRVMAPQVFEADWVRSKGRVRVLQDPSGNAAILWVNRPQKSVSANVPSVVSRQPAHAYVEMVGNR